MEKTNVVEENVYLDNFKKLMYTYGGDGADFTKVVPREKRYLDYLAELLAISSNSTCVAVSINGDSLIISTNEFHSNMKDSGNIITTITDTLEYLNNFAQAVNKDNYDAIIPQIRQNAFKKDDDGFCLQEIRNAILAKLCFNSLKYMTAQGGAGGIKVSENACKEIFNSYILTEINFTREDARILSNQEDDFAPSILYTYELFAWLTDSLKKLERHVGREECSLDFLNAIQKNVLLMNKNAEVKHGKIHGNSTVHAEAQIISYLIRLIDNNTLKVKESPSFFIGISKTCCLDCHRLVSAINQVAEKYGRMTPFVFVSGWHDICFNKFDKSGNLLFDKTGHSNWELPLAIIESTGFFSNEVKQQYELEKMKELKPLSPIIMTHKRTDSRGSQTADDLIIDYKKHIQEKLLLIPENSSNFLLANCLCECKDFKLIISNPELVDKNLFFNILNELQVIWKREISKEEMTSIFYFISTEDSLISHFGMLSDKAVKISNYFKDIENVLFMQPQNPKVEKTKGKFNF